MKRVQNTGALKIVQSLMLGLGLLALLTGCEEANMALDKIVGMRAPIVSSSPVAEVPIVLAKMRQPGERPVTPAETTPAVEAPKPGTPKPEVATPEPPGKHRPPGARPGPPGVAAPERPSEPSAPAEAPIELLGKKREPGQRAPVLVQEEPTKKEVFIVPRDPFKKPTEILPSECPPSMPLCRFDRSQLKLVGVIQVSDGHFKGLVEDPDGRGYFITAGMQIGGATVVQVSNRGVTLHVSKTKQDVVMPLFLETRETTE